MQTSDRTVLITGGSAGIGLATAEAFSAAGSEVIICGRNEARLQRARDRIPAIHTIRCDITRHDELESLVAGVRRDFPRLDILVNNAGVEHTYDFAAGNGSHQQIEDEVQTNLVAPIKLTGLLLPTLQQHDSAAVVLVSSALALVPLATAPIYSAAKAGLHSFSLSLRYRLKGTSVEVFEVLPPWVDTDLSRAVDGPKISPEEVAEAILDGMTRDRHEIHVGRVKPLSVLSRFAPALAERMINRSTAG